MRVGQAQGQPPHVRSLEGRHFRPRPRAVPEYGDHDDAQAPLRLGQEPRAAREQHVVVMRRHVEAVAGSERLEIDRRRHGMVRIFVWSPTGGQGL